jgi:cytochrome P450
MVDYLVQTHRTDETVGGISRLAINVQLAVQYDIYIPWLEDGTAKGSRTAEKVANDLRVMIPMFTIVMGLPHWLITLPFWPKSVREAAAASMNLPLHLKDLLEEERNALATSGDARNTFLSNLLLFAETEKDSSDSERQQPLTDNELVANLFLFTLASFDTTASTISYAISMLAIYPKWQDWIIEEIDEVARNHNGLNFEDAFPKLTRCLAIMVSVARFLLVQGRTHRDIVRNTSAVSSHQPTRATDARAANAAP